LFKIYENILYWVTLCADSEYAKQKRLERGYTAVKRNVVVSIKTWYIQPS